MDQTRARLMPHSRHTRKDREIAYRAMQFAAELLLGCGRSVILDAPYGHPEDRRQVGAMPLYLVECKVSPAVATARFRGRDPSHPGMPGLTPKRVAEMARTFPYSVKGLLIDTGELSAEECLALIKRYLDSGRPLPPGAWTS